MRFQVQGIEAIYSRTSLCDANYATCGRQFCTDILPLKLLSSALFNFALEGAIHAKQYDDLQVAASIIQCFAYIDKAIIAYQDASFIYDW
jgi:hypothetical protein